MGAPARARTAGEAEEGAADGGQTSAGGEVDAVLPVAHVATRAAQDRVVLVNPRGGRAEGRRGTVRTVGGYATAAGGRKGR